MRQFLLKIMYFSAPFLVVTLLMELLLRSIPNDYVLKKVYLDKHSAEIETLILGSSHSYYGLNPDYFSSNTFNASHISQTLDYDYALLQKYQSNFENLKTIILPISYFTLFDKLEESTESWRVKNYVIYYKLNTAESLLQYSEVLSNRIDVNLTRLLSYYILDQSQITSSELGWGTNNISVNAKDLIETGKIAAHRHTVEDIYDSKNQTLLKDNLMMLDSIVEFCKVRNINLLILTLPTYITYRKHLNNEQLKVTIETCNNIATTYNNSTYLNLLSDKDFIEKDFFDADHLSEIGAAKLSIRINKKIN